MQTDSRKCKTCNRWKRKDKEYCYFCDPEIGEIEKAKSRGKGGRNSRRIPHNLRGDNYRPLSIENIRQLLEDLITTSIDNNADDFGQLVKEVKSLIPRAAEYAMLERLIQVSEDIALLKENRLNLLEGNYVDDLIHNRNGS